MPCALRRCAPCLGNCRFCRWLLLLARSQPLASFLLIFYVFFHLFFPLTVMDSRVVADGRMESRRPRPCRAGTSSVPSFWFFWSVSFWPGSHWIQKGTVCTACSCYRSGCRAEREFLVRVTCCSWPDPRSETPRSEFVAPHTRRHIENSVSRTGCERHVKLLLTQQPTIGLPSVGPITVRSR